MTKAPALLTENRDAIRSLKPADQAIAYYVSSWESHLGDLDALRAVHAECQGSISRSDLFRFAATAASTKEYRDILGLFLGTMVWGYGTTGYGPWRTREMLDTPGFRQIVEGSFADVLAGRVGAAYQAFQVKRCGPPFFTKYFYFAGRGNRVPDYPLILDTRVYEALKAAPGVDVSKYVKNSTWWYPEGYVRYVEDVHCWARELGCEAHNIELFLFSMPRSKGGASGSNRP